MFKLRFPAILIALIAASALHGQESPAMDPEACAKHCREMAAANQKAMDERQAAWKEIQAELEVARNARGDKKVAALESAVEKLVAFHAPMPGGAAGCPMMEGHGRGPIAGHAMDCCGGQMKGCCGAGAAGHAGHGPHCPMMKGGTEPPAAPKPSN
jgi:hypothetical protein